ncbi:alpha/beta fold hydrolase [Tissierella sp. Yu-01]|uniref:alpha/beta hydrolase family protein n=1 Tax=Tissierella sp. Yu-01 TaxID=3035694 RepID=UPI00240D8F20|nr:alpha/beta fold hydrolase [Tissierella sp. Yu-01]WFA10165.1 alpha/beta hydrolase [Tissierella sp. Yu-01]
MNRFIFLLIVLLLFIVSTGCTSNKTFKEEDFNLDVNGGTIYGTLIIPNGESGDGTYPVALIHQGSGPTDRDGNSNIIGDNNSLKMLAEGLAEAGIASVRYDKRGIAKSMDLIEKEEDLVFEDYISDVKLWVSKLRDDSRFDRVFIIGHSEGALIGGQAAADSDVEGFVSIAGVGHSAYDTLIRQLSTQQKEITDVTTPMLDQLKEGKLIENVPQELYSLFRPSVQPYMISWFKYDPVEVYKNISAPILILQGDNDIQVTVEDAERLSTAKDSKLVIIKGMNHILKNAPTDPEENLKTYSDPDLPINEELMREIIEFINL